MPAAKKAPARKRADSAAPVSEEMQTAITRRVTLQDLLDAGLAVVGAGEDETGHYFNTRDADGTIQRHDVVG